MWAKGCHLPAPRLSAHMSLLAPTNLDNAGGPDNDCGGKNDESSAADTRLRRRRAMIMLRTMVAKMIPMVDSTNIVQLASQPSYLCHLVRPGKRTPSAVA